MPPRPSSTRCRPVARTSPASSFGGAGRFRTRLVPPATRYIFVACAVKLVSYCPMPPPDPDPELARWIRRELAADPPRVPSLIVTVWGDALVPHGGAAWLATLIALLGEFGVNERAVRTGVFRVARDGWLVAQPVGRRSRYQVSGQAGARFARAFHRVYDSPFEPWDGEWEAVVPHSNLGPASRRRLRDELAWAGFAEFAPGVHLRPARRDGVAARIVEAL
ncbi:MAG: hypothetical protein DYH14_12050, partial [Betaproteobacteria bacterium PRO3]|nr:hypothetical protein [Betaproteobacteria bacterium PRO3]